MQKIDPRYLSLPTEAVIKSVRRTGSTNDDLKRVAMLDVNEPYVLFAAEQTAGRGRTGRTFYSRDGLYMSVLFPSLPTETASFLTHIAAVAVARSIREVTGLPALIKWVNAVYIDGKKVCGILSESVPTPFGRRYIVGIGVNVGTPKGELPSDIQGIAAYFAGDKNALAARITEALFRLVNDFDVGALREEYAALSFLLGKTVTVSDAAGERPATVLGLTPSLGLEVRYSDGTRAELISGEVHLIL